MTDVQRLTEHEAERAVLNAEWEVRCAQEALRVAQTRLEWAKKGLAEPPPAEVLAEVTTTTIEIPAEELEALVREETANPRRRRKKNAGGYVIERRPEHPTSWETHPGWTVVEGGDNDSYHSIREALGRARELETRQRSGYRYKYRVSRLAEVDRRKRAEENPATPNYKEAHWGREAPNGIVAASAGDPSRGPLVAYGELVSVTYGTMKGRDKRITNYVHGFKKTKPVLAFNKEGRLIIVGGSYTCEARGIVG